MICSLVFEVNLTIQIVVHHTQNSSYFETKDKD